MVLKRRLIFWLAKAYIKRWGKRILLYFLIGLGVFFGLLWLIPYLWLKFPIIHKENIGVVGAYTEDNLPKFVLDDIGQGLTAIGQNEIPKPALATFWKVRSDGKAFAFSLRHDISFSDGTKFTSSEVNYAFTDVSIKRPDPYTVVFYLTGKDAYAPFLATVSRPILRKNIVGTGPYKVAKITLNGNFIESLILASNSLPQQVKIYHFYPTENALKTAYALGEIDIAQGVTNTSLEQGKLAQFPNTTIAKTADYSKLITLFYNCQDKDLSDKRLRDALTYALPDSFSQGERAYGPYPPTSWAYQQDTSKLQDMTHTQLLLKLLNYSSDSLSITLSTLSEEKPVADIIAKEWQKAGIKVSVEQVDSIPSHFQVFLGAFTMPKDPDQYSLWHSGQPNNIANYKSLRIDKLLEDGRKTINTAQRAQIYADFQKYLSDDPPAAFLYFPYEYTITRR